MGKQSKNNGVTFESGDHQSSRLKEIFRITNQGEIEVDGKVVNDDATLAKLLREFAKVYKSEGSDWKWNFVTTMDSD